MASPPDRPAIRRAAAIAIALLVGLAVRLPTLDAPLLEGAAGKQTHTAMAARNLYRDRATWSRPVVDDIGRPGYFIKELPILPTAAAAAYALLGGVHEWVGRLLPAAAWLAAVPLLVCLAERVAGGAVPLIAGLWFVLAPLGLVYSRAFMNDAIAVAVSLAALWLGVVWRDRPSAARAAAVGAAVGASLLAKPHTAFWLAPALLALALSPGPTRRERAHLGLAAVVGAALAAPWYVHAWRVHRTYPIPGALVAEGWVDASLWLRPELYRIIAAQELWMVFTPPGLVLAVLAIFSPERPRGALWAALLIWGAGVALHCAVLATRMFDEAARGTEYYQLALVPVAAVLIALGLRRLAAMLAARPALRGAALAAFAAALLGSAAAASLEALAAPPRYQRLLDDCQQIQSLTDPRDEIAVLADRPGTALYHCDRRGMALVPTTGAGASPGVAPGKLAADLARVRYVWVAFPELLEATPRLAADLETRWRVPPGTPPGLLLYERRRVPVPPRASG